MAYPPPPYQDAVAGTFVAGEALAGTWWAYPPSAGLGLGAPEPDVLISLPFVPAAGLRLGALAPTTRYTISAPLAGLALGTQLPLVRISSILLPDPAGLGLAAFVPKYVGPLYLHIIRPADCEPLDLAPDPEGELVLVGAGAEEITLDPVECL
jgi:hypothetical protein